MLKCENGVETKMYRYKLLYSILVIVGIFKTKTKYKFYFGVIINCKSINT